MRVFIIIIMSMFIGAFIDEFVTIYVYGEHSKKTSGSRIEQLDKICQDIQDRL